MRLRSASAIELACFALVALWADVAIAAELGLPEDCIVQTLPVDDPDYPQGQLTLICLPEDFNGQVFIYAHGYVPPQEPIRLPVEELGSSDVRELIDRLMALGYGFATTSYRKNGFAIEVAQADIADLVDEVHRRAPETEKIWIVGASEGGLITTMLVEKFPEIYDGGLALCGPLEGIPAQLAYLADFRAVFDYYFPYIFAFGPVDVPEDAYLAWETYADDIEQAIKADPASSRQLFAVTGAACPSDEGAEAARCAKDLLAYGIFGINDLQAIAGGQPYGNRKTTYEGSDDDAALNAGVTRFSADPSARKYVRRWYRPTGRLERQLVTLHTTRDNLVPFSHELAYLERAARAGELDKLTPLPVSRDGHCNFQAQEVIGGLVLLLLLSDADVPPAADAYLRSLPDVERLDELLDETLQTGKRRLRKAVDSVQDRVDDLFQ